MSATVATTTTTLEQSWCDFNLLTDAGRAISAIRPGGSWVLVGSGSSLPLCSLASHWMSARYGVAAQVLTPYQLECYGHPIDQAFVLSAEGRNGHILRAARFLANQKISTHLLTLTSNSAVEQVLSSAGVLIALTIGTDPRRSFEGRVDEFVPLDRCVAFCRMLIELFAVDDASRDTWTTVAKRILAEPFVEEASLLTGRTMVTVVASSEGTPAAQCLENAMVETGRAAVNISDPGNFRHGRFMLLAEQEESSALLCIGHDRFGWLSDQRLAIPRTIPQIRLSSEVTGCDAAMELMLRTLALLRSIQSFQPSTRVVQPWIRPLCDPPLESVEHKLVPDKAGDAPGWTMLGPYGEAYLPSAYYRKLLKPYSSGGKTDLDMLQAFLNQHPVLSPRVLELGAGDGRATDVLLGSETPRCLPLVDLSHEMISGMTILQNRFAFIEPVRSDILSFVDHAQVSFDRIVALWSLSHSVHQRLLREGVSTGSAGVRRTLRRLFTELLAPHGSSFIIHFDSLSEEQRISIRQRRKMQNLFAEGEQSPSKRLLDETLDQLKRERVIDYRVSHVQGDAIVFNTMDEALEVFMNFHMEAMFNNTELIQDVLKELRDDLRKHKSIDGRISVIPAWFVYEIEKS